MHVGPTDRRSRLCPHADGLFLVVRLLDTIASQNRDGQACVRRALAIPAKRLTTEA